MTKSIHRDPLQLAIERAHPRAGTARPAAQIRERGIAKRRRSDAVLRPAASAHARPKDRKIVVLTVV